MAVGMTTTYDNTVGIKRSVSDLVTMIDPREIPLITKFGLNGESKFRLINWPTTKPEWPEDTLTPTSDTLGAAIANGTATTVTPTTIDYYKVGQVWEIPSTSEKLWVSAVGASTITVVRGYGSTAGAAAANGADLNFLYTARLEGADADKSFTTTMTNPYNYTQIFQREIEVSRTDQKTQRYGVSDLYNYHLMKFVGGTGAGGGNYGDAGELSLELERTFFHGERLVGSKTTPRGMGGIDTYLTTNVTDLSAAALTETALEDILQDCYNSGGRPDCLIMNVATKRKISALVEDRIRTDRSERTAGNYITTWESESLNSALDILISRDCPNNTIYATQTSKIGWITFDEFADEVLAKTGDSMQGQVVGEFSFVVTNEKAHGKLHNFT